MDEHRRPLVKATEKRNSRRHCDPASYLSRLNGLLKVLAEDIPAYQWYMALPQLVSHMGLQDNVKCSQILNGIVSKVVAKYPRTLHGL